MNAANRPRISDLNVNRSGRTSQRSRRAPVFFTNRLRSAFVRSPYTARNRRARRLASRMIQDDSSNESSHVSDVAEELDTLSEDTNDVLPSSSTASSNANRVEAHISQGNAAGTSVATTSRNANRESREDTQAAVTAAQADFPTPSSRRGGGAANATVVSAALADELQEIENTSTSASSIIEISTPSPPKKRKRIGSATPKSKGTPKLGGKTVNSDDDGNDVDDGCTCPICFDSWEMSGEHRLVSLRCGHLFGESCIRRWLAECGRQSGVKMCPQCKTKATPRDIRYLYAKRVRAVDRTEEHELRQSLEEDRRKLKNVEIELDTLKITYAVTMKKVQEQELEIERLRSSYRLRSNALFLEEVESPANPKVFKLFMEKNIVFSRDSGCRVMKYASKHSALLMSKKNSNNLFPGYGIRFIDVPSFKPTQFIHLTTKMLRDISLSVDQQIMACTSLETSAKMYDFRLRTPVMITAPNSDKKLWACAMGDASRENYLYAGGQQGSTFVFDLRQPSDVIAEYETIGDLSPVVSIVVIPKTDDFPLGGFCICKLQSVWFYEYQTNGDVLPTRLNVEGPFMSMNYDESQTLLIITARVNPPDTESRYLVGKLKKIQQRTHFEVTATLLGSNTTPVMTRSCHISVESQTLFSAYIQDSKQLALFDIDRKLRIQSIPIYDVVFDVCPIYTSTDVFVAALTESKCRIYKINES